jgi:predicted nuclease of predicted toxin-antitoxin system
LKFKVDENLPEELTQLLRDAGWDSASVVEQHLGGADDPLVAQVCSAENRILITFDRGFSNIKRHPATGLQGIVVFRLKRQDKRHVLNVSSRLVHELQQRELSGEIWIVHETRIRIRFLKDLAGPE